MHFGRLASVEGKKLQLPPDAIRTIKFLNLLPHNVTKVYMGCPVWAERAWVGSLYPKGTKPNEFLKAYAEVFKTVEVNSTFYQLLDPSRFMQWREQVPADFRFCPKVYRGITEQLAAPNLPQLIETFCNGMRALMPKLGLVFAQLPEGIGPRQGALFNRFIHLWPTDVPLAVEFRHPGWFKNHALLDELVNFLYRNKVAAVITDTAGRRDALHLSLTQPKVLIRFLGNKLHESDFQRLSEWAERLYWWSQHHLEDVYFFTHQPDQTLIPRTALVMSECWQKHVPQRLPQLEKAQREVPFF